MFRFCLYIVVLFVACWMSVMFLNVNKRPVTPKVVIGKTVTIPIVPMISMGAVPTIQLKKLESYSSRVLSDEELQQLLDRLDKSFLAETGSEPPERATIIEGFVKQGWLIHDACSWLMPWRVYNLLNDKGSTNDE